MGIFDYSKNDVEWPTKIQAYKNTVGPQTNEEGIVKRFPVLWDVDTTDDKGKELSNWLHTFRQEYVDLANRTNTIVEDGRNKSLALTALEEAYHRTVRAILA